MAGVPCPGSTAIRVSVVLSGPGSREVCRAAPLQHQEPLALAACSARGLRRSGVSPINCQGWYGRCLTSHAGGSSQGWACVLAGQRLRAARETAQCLLPVSLGKSQKGSLLVRREQWTPGTASSPPEVAARWASLPSCVVPVRESAFPEPPAALRLAVPGAGDSALLALQPGPLPLPHPGLGVGLLPPPSTPSSVFRRPHVPAVSFVPPCMRGSSGDCGSPRKPCDLCHLALAPSSSLVHSEVGVSSILQMVPLRHMEVCGLLKVGLGAGVGVGASQSVPSLGGPRQPHTSGDPPPRLSCC